MQNELAEGTLKELYRAINPKIDELEKRSNEILSEVSKERERVGELNDAWATTAMTWQDAGFIVGIAFAQHSGGDLV